MNFNLNGYTTAQQRCLLDLLILAMYADSHLSLWEEAWLQDLMAQMGHQQETLRQREFDAAVSRIRHSLDSVHTAKDHAMLLAKAFKCRDQQKQVYDAVQWVMGSDGHISTWERFLLSELRIKFRL